MSMQSMQTILWRGASDREFLNLLLEAPGAALSEYDLSPPERAALVQTPARSLTDFAVTVEAWRRGEPLPIATRELALAV